MWIILQSVSASERPKIQPPLLIAVGQEFDLVSMPGWSHSLSQSVKIGCSLLQRSDRRVRFDWCIPGFVDILDSYLESHSCEWNLSSSLCESAACISPACLRAPPSQSEHAPDSGFIRRGSEWSCSQTWTSTRHQPSLNHPVAVCGVHLDPRKREEDGHPAAPEGLMG